MQSPYSLSEGDEVTAQVIVTNLYGSSLPTIGSGAKIITMKVPDAPLQLTTDYTSFYQVNLIWSPPASNGGSPIVNYIVSYTNDTVFTVYANVTTLSVSVLGLTPNTNYRFTVQAQNVIGVGAQATPILVKTLSQDPNVPITVPAQPAAPVVTIANQVATITWAAPDNGGAPITGYVVTVAQSDSVTFSENKINCDAFNSVTTQCSMPVDSLMAAPYYLTWGSAVIAKVAAINAYGYSRPSLASQGVQLITSPGAPQNLSEDPSQRSISTLGLVWSPPTFTGGAAVIEYRVVMVTDATTQIVYVTSPQYYATDLIAGSEYTFAVFTRTSYGYSVNSNPLTLICGTAPSTPDNVTVDHKGFEITVSWSESNPNGLTIFNYTVYTLAYDQQFIPVTCDRILPLSCTIHMSTLMELQLSLQEEENIHLRYGSDIIFKVSASNSIGESQLSPQTQAVQVYKIPSSPVELEITDDVLSWSPGEDGGTNVLQYSIWWDQGNSTWTQINITKNPRYEVKAEGSYKVTATNIIGTSEFSSIVNYKPKYSSSTGLIVGVIIGVAVIIALLVIAYLMYRRKQTVFKLVPEEVTQGLEITQHPLKDDSYRGDIESQSVVQTTSSLPFCLPQSGIVTRQRSAVNQNYYEIGSVSEVIHLHEETEQQWQAEETLSEIHEEEQQADLVFSEKHIEEAQENELDDLTAGAIASLGLDLDIVPQSVNVQTQSVKSESPVRVKDESQDLHSLLYPPSGLKEDIVLDSSRYFELEDDDLDARQQENSVNLRDPPTLMQRYESRELFHPVARPQIETIAVTTIQSTKPKIMSNNDSQGNYTNVTRATIKDQYKAQMSKTNELSMQLTKKMSEDLLQPRPKPYHELSPYDDRVQNRMTQSQPNIVDVDPDADEILKMIQNLWEKKALGAMTTLDKQLLKKLIKLVKSNPKNYGKKVGYLQLMYM